MFSRINFRKNRLNTLFNSRTLITSPLQPLHNNLNPSMGDFGDYELPMTFKNYKIGETTTNIRKPNHCCIFDVSHMGVLDIVPSLNQDYDKSSESSDNLGEISKFMEELYPINTNILTKNRSVLSPVLNQQCEVIDDFIVGNIDDRKYRLIVNSATKHKFKAFLDKELKSRNYDSTLFTTLHDKVILAIQGDYSQRVLEHIFNVDVSLDNLYFMENMTINDSIEISRCGYTGEDGFELYLDKHEGIKLYSELLKMASTNSNIMFGGLIERDILRLEAGLCLSGSEFSPDLGIHFNDTNLDFTIGKRRRSLDNCNFIGNDYLSDTSKFKRVGFSCKRPIKKTEIYLNNNNDENNDDNIDDNDNNNNLPKQSVGFITSASKSYGLNKFIGMGYVSSDVIKTGGENTDSLESQFYFNNNGKKVDLTLESWPFIKASYYRK